MLYYEEYLVKKLPENGPSQPSWWWCASGSRASVRHSPALVFHAHLIDLAHSPRSFTLALVDTQFHSVLLFPYHQKKKKLHAACGADLKKKHRSGRVQSVFSLPFDGQSRPSFVVESGLLPAQLPSRKQRLRRSVARGGACFRARASHSSIVDPSLLPKIRANRSWPCPTNHVRPNSTATLTPRGPGSSKEVSLVKGKSGLTPAREIPPPPRYMAAMACFRACLTEAAGERRYNIGSSIQGWLLDHRGDRLHRTH